MQVKVPLVLDGTHPAEFSDSWVQLDLRIKTEILHKYRIVFKFIQRLF